MSQINFLPEMFQRERRRQQRRPAEFLAIGLTLVALVALWLSTSGPDSVLANQAEQLDQELEAIAQIKSEQDRLFRERSGLQRKLMTARETYQPISATQVLSRLSGLTPEPIRLLNVEIDAERPAPESKPAAAGNKKVVGKKDQAKPADPNQMKLTINGHAPSDEQLVTLIRRLNNDPVFTSVTLRGSRQDKTETHFVRAFHLDVVIDLDRRFVDENGGDADAD
ncbi:MAG: PilN domain-containing protein [Planctomycetota bacterium]